MDWTDHYNCLMEKLKEEPQQHEDDYFRSLQIQLAAQGSSPVLEIFQNEPEFNSQNHMVRST